MANAQPNPAVEYLRQNKDRFPLDVLRQKLAEAGYPKEVIDAAVIEVFQLGGSVSSAPSTAPTSGFFDFRNVKIYHSFGEKVGDFLFGWLGSWVLYWVFGSSVRLILLIFRLLFGYRFYGPPLGSFGLFVFLILQVAGIVYFWKRRHYFAIGLLFAILILVLTVPLAYRFYYIDFIINTFF